MKFHHKINLGVNLILLLVTILFVFFSPQIFHLTGKFISAENNLTETINFEAGLTKNLNVVVENIEKKDFELIVYSEGELAENIFLEKSKFSLTKEQNSVEIPYKISLPEDLNPGIHSVDIVVLKIFEGKTESIITNVYVVVPYPGKYAEAELSVENSIKDREARFKVFVKNLGKVDLSNVEATIDIYSDLGEKIDTLNTESISITASQTKEIISKWSVDVAVGNYKAVGNLFYDNEVYEFEKTFRVGSDVLELQQVYVRDFSLGGIAKFEFLVENQLDEVLKDVYVEAEIKKGENSVAEFKSSRYDVPFSSKYVLVAFWNTKNIASGNYDFFVSFITPNKNFKQELEIEILEDDIKVSGLDYSLREKNSFIDKNKYVGILAIVVIVLILINVAWMLFGRKLK